MTPASWPAADAFWPAVTRLGEAQILLPAALLCTAWLAWRSGTPRTAALWLATLAAAAFVTTASKLAFIGWGVGSATLDFTGFSGHAMFAAATLPVLLRALAGSGIVAARNAAAAGMALAALVAWSRVAVDAHSAPEALAGFLLGSAASGFVLVRGDFLALRPQPRWAPLLLLAWLLVTSGAAPPSRTHDMVTRLALALSGRPQPYTRADLHRDVGADSSRPSALPTLGA